MQTHEKINYLEYPASNLSATKIFFKTVFGWVFTDFGEDYIAFDNQGLEGGFYRSGQVSKTEHGATLTVFYSDDLRSTQTKIEAAGGSIIRQAFEFPGGRRFHFTDPNGNEFAVWSSD